MSSRFPKDFVWGAAAASYQIEGAHDADGKGQSVWDMYCRKPDVIYEGHTGNVACDHYHRYRDDIALMREIGLRAYRLSVSWPRVLPDGIGAVNERGLDFYDRVVDSLLDTGIEPYVTVFHWDYPLKLYQRGGWLNPDSPSWFAEYSDLLCRRLSDRVTRWMTFNEPQVFSLLGHQTGVHAPGDKLELSQQFVIMLNVLRAHGKSTQALRSAAKKPIKIGYAPVGFSAIPATSSAEDERAALDYMFRCDGATPRNLWGNTWWMDPVFLGRFPEDGLQQFGPVLPAITGDDLATIHQPLDFFGCNIYGGEVVRAGADGKPAAVKAGPGAAMSALNWVIAPDALYWGPRRFWERYQQPVLITENGMSSRDFVALDGRVHDPQRIDFMTRYLRALHRAITEGVEVFGYMHWSIMDNFEWAEGYKERFGLIYVDYETQQRTLKDSAYYYRDVIASNGQALFQPHHPPT